MFEIFRNFDRSGTVVMGAEGPGIGIRGGFGIGTPQQNNDNKTQRTVSGGRSKPISQWTFEMKKIASLRNVCLAALAATFIQQSQALVVPFVEDFVSGNSNWIVGTSTPAPWFSSGGVGDGGYIGTTATISTGGFGPIIFRGNAANDSSDDAFVGNWLSGGVSLFTAFVRHDAPVSVNFYVRFDAGDGAAASGSPIEVPTGVWTELSMPIIDSVGAVGSGAIFQSYGAAGPSGFNTIFSNIQNVQIALSSIQDPDIVGNSYNIGLDQVSIVPEPGTIGLAGGAGLLLLGLRVWRNRKK